MKSFQAISVTGRETAELVERQEDRPLAPDQVEGSTLFTLVSPGTELAGIYLGERFPAFPGYAAVFRVEEIGADVQTVSCGDLLFCMGNHQAGMACRLCGLRRYAALRSAGENRSPQSPHTHTGA